MSCIQTAVAETAAKRTVSVKQAAKTMIVLKVAALAAAAVIGVLSAAGAGERSSLYPEGSIFLRPADEPSVAGPSVAARGEAQLSPLNPLDAPAAGNVWKPSNRDAGNLSARGWQEYYDRRAEQRRGP
jgi:hypothetical protein